MLHELIISPLHWLEENAAKRINGGLFCCAAKEAVYGGDQSSNPSIL
jgi:hypothetical protein